MRSLAMHLANAKFSTQSHRILLLYVEDVAVSLNCRSHNKANLSADAVAWLLEGTSEQVTSM
jgi:hypothetical protein